jgi:uncharacterized protein YcaQ
VLYFVGFFENALPEELFFRRMVLPRLEALVRNSLNVLVISAWMFNLMHLPADRFVVGVSVFSHAEHRAGDVMAWRQRYIRLFDVEYRIESLPAHNSF